MLPDISGRIVLQHLKSEPTLASIPVIIVSILASDYRGHLHGAAAFVDKPVSRELLLEKIYKVFPMKASSDD